MNDILLYENIPTLENNFSVKFMEHHNLLFLPPHWHEHIELLYFLSGNCQFTCNGKTFSVGPHDFVIVNSTQIHTFEATTPVSYFCILIYPSFFNDVDFNSKMLLKNLIYSDEHIKKYVKIMHEEYSQKKQNYDMLLKGTAYQLMAHLLRNYATVQLSDKELVKQKNALQRMSKLLIYISNHYHEKITNEQLSRLCYVSEGHLCRFFKNYTGKTLTEYINNFRIEKAAVMLANTEECITDIALSVGFEDLNYFSRTFKKIKKLSPQEYRKGLFSEKGTL